MLIWTKEEMPPPITRRELVRLVDEKPVVMGDVVESRDVKMPGGGVHPGGVELRIVALFKWHRGPTQALFLRREPIDLAVGAFHRAKQLVAHYWSEHLASGELEVLREMWELPTMTQSQLAAHRVKQLKKKKEAEERARKTVLLDPLDGTPNTVDLIDARKEAVAKTGGKAD